MYRFLCAAVTAMVAVACAQAQTSETASGVVNRAPYQITVGGEVFAPPDRVPEDLASRVQEAAQARAALTGPADNKAHILVQFDAPLTAEFRQQLDNIGVNILSRIDSRAWIASANAQSASRLLRTDGVRWADVYPVDVKLSAAVRRDELYEWQKRDGGRAAYSVVFHDDVAAREVAQLRESDLRAELENFDANAFAIVRVLNVVIDPADLNALAAADIVRWIEPEAPPVVDGNLLNVQPLSNVDDVQVAPYGLSGAGINVGIWEANDVIRATHNDLSPRVIIQAGQTASQDNHAAHVAGTVGASGVNFPNAEGMAPAVTIASWDTANDANEMTNAATSPGGAGNPTPVVIANHSNNFDPGWPGGGGAFSALGFANFGAYTATSQAYDNVVTGTGLIAFRAAGNNRDDVWDGATPQPPGTPIGTRDCTQGGFGVDADCLPDSTTAKNIITVGAMNGAGAIAGFSSFGPTDDGRIKPDIMAHGVNVFSLSNVNDNGTINMGGTSMSTPAVSGIAALILEEAGNLGLTITAEGMKALLLQTAQDVAGVGQATVGPDFATGYGIADAQAAVDLLRRPGGPGYATGTIAATGAAGAWNFPFVVPAGQPEIRVTLAWSDPAGTPGGAVLVNDLDLRLIPPGGGAAQRPWQLNPGNPGVAAVRNGGDDTVNNVEQVSVLNPAAGTWTVRVTAKAGSLVLGSQNFAIAGPITPATGPIAGPKANIMMVLDKSGSMLQPAATAGMNKMESLQNAASAFVDYIELVGGHNAGIVAFDSAVRATTPPFGLQTLDGTSAPNARIAIDNLSPGGATAIIRGVQEAVTQLGGAAATNPNDIVFLFSDGRHNTPSGSDVSTIDGIMASDTRFFSIGFGTDVDSTVMPGVAANHDGVHLEEQALNAGQLAKLFMVVGGLAADESIVIDPDYAIAPNAVVRQSIVATKEDRSLTFVTFWNNTGSDMSFFLNGPNRKCKIADTPHTGYDIRTGLRYRLIRVELPYQCASTGQNMHEGVWSLAVRNLGNAPDTAKIMVLADSALKLSTKATAKGGTVFLQASLTQHGKPVCKAANISAYFTRRVPSTGDSAELDAIRGTLRPIIQPGRVPDRTQPARVQPGAVQPGGAVVQDEAETTAQATVSQSLQRQTLTTQKVDRRLLELAKLRPQRVILNDRGRNGDEKAKDCVYGARISMPAGSGMQQARIVASMGAGSKAVTREAFQSVVVK